MTLPRGRGDVPAITFGLLRQLGRAAGLPAYRRALTRACAAHPPPFGQAEYGDAYREAATDPAWLAVSLLTNADREGDGAQRLWSLAACTADPVVAAQLKRHAIDESNHAKVYLRIVDLVFDSAIDDGFRAQLQALSPNFTRAMTPAPLAGSPYAHAVTLDDLIQMNIAEIRTTIHHLLQRSMLSLHCPDGRQARLARLLDNLLRDEIRHVAYTAALIEGHAAHADRAQLEALFSQRVQDFNDVTRAELAQRVFDGS